jgi:hypothetical protein
MMSDWPKVASLAFEDVGPNHIMSYPGGFSGDRDPSLDILLDPVYSGLGCAPNLGSYDSGSSLSLWKTRTLPHQLETLMPGLSSNSI